MDCTADELDLLRKFCLYCIHRIPVRYRMGFISVFTKSLISLTVINRVVEEGLSHVTSFTSTR